MESKNLDNILENAAEAGKFSISRELWKKQQDKLNKAGITTTPLEEKRTSKPQVCLITWKDCIVDDLTIPLNSPDLSQGQRLWIIATTYKK